LATTKGESIDLTPACFLVTSNSLTPSQCVAAVRYLTLCCRTFLLLCAGERWPMNLGREVLADLAGNPERADWKACSVSEEEEKKRTDRFKEAFKPYDVLG